MIYLIIVFFFTNLQRTQTTKMDFAILKNAQSNLPPAEEKDYEMGESIIEVHVNAKLDENTTQQAKKKEVYVVNNYFKKWMQANKTNKQK